ncbi:MAG: hypothetical protein JXR77_18470, partial [Lentisphaeria bacterium]|nr:hypothetical protein [Lentisphaeria bacterium]
SVALDGPVVIDRGQPLRGAGSLRVREPVVVSIPRTAALGPSVTLALSARGIPPGHRRLFSAYNGGSIREGEGELVFDLVAGGAFPDGTGLRFQYDGVHVAARVSDLPGWADAFAGDAVHHLAVTWDDGVVCLFYDGTMVASGGSPGRGEVRLALGDLRFGEDYPPTGLANEPFLGTADDILVLAEALSGEDLARLAAEGSGFLVDRQARGVLYSMDDAAGTTLIDRLTADGASDATLPASAGPLPGDCQLLLNAATSAGGGIRVELQDGNGVALPGHGLADSDVLFGDGIDLAASWGQRTELRHLAGQPVRIRFELRDADLYALRFGRPESLLPRGPDRAEH